MTTPTATALAQRAPSQRRKPGDLMSTEHIWRDNYELLKSRGYLLRPRYEPDWTPSWQHSKRGYQDAEDGLALKRLHVGDATRVSDGAFVALKMVNKSDNPFEADIGTLLSSEPLASNPLNHCVPIYDVFTLPNDDKRTFLVMPLLRKYDDPRFETIGEAVEFIRQIFEGLNFMHENNIAHRDVNANNVMLDPRELYPDSFHPVKTNLSRDFNGEARHFTRSQRPPKYYLIDFGLSRRYRAEDRPPSEPIIQGGDRSAPEHQGDLRSCDPFPTDVYYAGNLVRQAFLNDKRGFGFLKQLVADMVQDDPAKRPTMDQVVARFEEIRVSLDQRTLRSIVINRNEFFGTTIVRAVPHYVGILKERLPSFSRRSGK